MLDLIALNNTARVMSDAEKMLEYDKLQEVFKTLENEGKKIKGRLREKVADVLNISPAQVGKIENIKHNAVEEVKSAVESGKLNISTANEIAKLDEETQKSIVNGTSEKPNLKNSDLKKLAENEKKKSPNDNSNENNFYFNETEVETLFAYLIETLKKTEDVLEKNILKSISLKLHAQLYGGKKREF